MDLFDLVRPDHVADPAWSAIAVARTRLQSAWDQQDLHEVIGKAKELVETIAKVVVSELEGTVADGIEFVPLVKAAQKELRRHPGNDTSQDQNIRALAQGAQSLVVGIAPLRNEFGTGHGRAHVPDVPQEMAEVVLEASLVWSRWALRRLGHMLADYPNDLLAAVQVGTSRSTLQQRFDAVVLPQQEAELQRRIGVAFGQQSAGGFGNATDVGVDPAINGGYEEFPVPYRVGLIEGMVLTPGGYIGLTVPYAARFVDLLGSVPASEGERVLRTLVGTVESATWPTHWRRDTEVDPSEVVAEIRRLSERLDEPVRTGAATLCDALERPDGER